MTLEQERVPKSSAKPVSLDGKIDPLSRNGPSERWLHLALEAAQMSAYQHDLNSHIVLRSYNPQRAKFTDILSEIWNYEDAIKNIHPDDQQRVKDQVAEVIRDNRELDVEFRMILSSGEVRWLQSKGQPVYDQDGTPLQLLTVVHDITERQEQSDRVLKTARELQQAQEKLALTLKLTGLIAMAGIRSGVPFASPELSRLFGYKDDFLWSAQTFLSNVHPDDREKVQQNIELHQQTLGRFEDEFRIILPDGEVRWVMHRVATVKGDAGEDIKTYLIQQDITRQKENEEQLRKKTLDLRAVNVKLEQFSSIVAHDLKGPLSSIKMAADMLAESELSPDSVQLLQFIINGTQRMSGLIQDLLALAKVQNEPQIPNQSVRIRDVLLAVEENLKSSIQKSHATLVYNSELPTVIGERFQLTQLFQNLIANAIKFQGPKRPRIVIDHQEEEEFWCFSVSDNGVGIESAHLGQIFEPFRRFHAEQFEGTGLGLSICKKIVERHGGLILVESHVGLGTKFTFTLRKWN